MSRSTRISLVVVAALVLAWLGSRAIASATAATVRVEATELRQAFGARATVVPAGEVAHVMPTEAGRVAEVLVGVGDVVEARQTLARIEPSEEAPTLDLLGEGEVLSAPIAGTVLCRRLAVGDALSAIVPPPLPLFEIADLTHLELRIEIPEEDAADVTVGQTAVVTIASERREIRLTRVAPLIERREHPLDDVVSRAASRVRVAWAPLPEGASLPAFSQLEVALERAPRHVDAALPRTAVRIREGRPSVLLSGAFGSEVFVTLGACDDERVEVEGLEAGTEVVLR